MPVDSDSLLHNLLKVQTVRCALCCTREINTLIRHHFSPDFQSNQYLSKIKDKVKRLVLAYSFTAEVHSSRLECQLLEPFLARFKIVLGAGVKPFNNHFCTLLQLTSSTKTSDKYILTLTYSKIVVVKVLALIQPRLRDLKYDRCPLTIMLSVNQILALALRPCDEKSKQESNASQRLASGYRINSAADDAAGNAVANKLTKDIQGVNTAIRNASDMYSASALWTIYVILDSMLVRMRELAIQSASGSYTRIAR